MQKAVLFGGGDEKTTPDGRQPHARSFRGSRAGPRSTLRLAEISVVLPPARTNIEWAQVGGSGASKIVLLIGPPSRWPDNPAKVWTAADIRYEQPRAAWPLRRGDRPGPRKGAVTPEGTGRGKSSKTRLSSKRTGEQLWTRGDGDMSQRDRNGLRFPSAGGVSYEKRDRIICHHGIGEAEAVKRRKPRRVIWKVTPAGPFARFAHHCHYGSCS